MTQEGTRQHLTGGKNAEFLRSFIPGLTAATRKGHLGHSQGIGTNLPHCLEQPEKGTDVGNSSFWRPGHGKRKVNRF